MSSPRRHGIRWPFVSRDHYNRDMDDVEDELADERHHVKSLERRNDRNRMQRQNDLVRARSSAVTSSARHQEELRRAYQAGGQKGYQMGATRGQQVGYRAGTERGQREGYQYGLEEGYEVAIEDVAERFGARRGDGCSPYGDRSAGGYGQGGASRGGPRGDRGSGGDGSRDNTGRPSDYPFATGIPGDRRAPPRAPGTDRPATGASGAARRGGPRQAQIPGNPARWHGRADTVVGEDD